jgi:hypothetical protein
LVTVFVEYYERSAVQEEMEKGVKGCLEDCANKMLMIECGKDCPLDLNCSNKRSGYLLGKSRGSTNCL